VIQESTTDLKKGRTQFFVSLNWPSKPPVPGSNRPLRQPESRRVVGVLERGGLLIADPEGPALDFEVGSSLEQLQAASKTHRSSSGNGRCLLSWGQNWT
jgi:hypothetical protein